MLGCTLLLYLRVSLGRAFLLHQHYLWKIPQRQQQFPVKFSLHRVEYLLIHGTRVCECVCEMQELIHCKYIFILRHRVFLFFFFTKEHANVFQYDQLGVC